MQRLFKSLTSYAYYFFFQLVYNLYTSNSKFLPGWAVGPTALYNIKIIPKGYVADGSAF